MFNNPLRLTDPSGFDGSDHPAYPADWTEAQRAAYDAWEAETRAYIQAADADPNNCHCVHVISGEGEGPGGIGFPQEGFDDNGPGGLSENGPGGTWGSSDQIFGPEVISNGPAGMQGGGGSALLGLASVHQLPPGVEYGQIPPHATDLQFALWNAAIAAGRLDPATSDAIEVETPSSLATGPMVAITGVVAAEEALVVGAEEVIAAEGAGSKLGLGLGEGLGREGYRSWSQRMGFKTWDELSPKMYGTDLPRVQAAMREAGEIHFNMEGFSAPRTPQLGVRFGEPVSSYTTYEYSAALPCVPTWVRQEPLRVYSCNPAGRDWHDPWNLRCSHRPASRRSKCRPSRRGGGLPPNISARF